MFLKAIANRILALAEGSERTSYRITGRGSLAVAQVEMPYTELLREGKYFLGATGPVTNAQAPLQDVPTTACTWMLWNGESDDGNSYLVDWFYPWLGSGTAAVGMTVLVGLTKAKQAAPSAGTGLVSGSASGGQAATKAILATGPTITGGTPVWTGIGGSLQAATATVGQGDQPLSVRILVPPNYGLAIALVSGTGTTAKYQFGMGWAELKLPDRF